MPAERVSMGGIRDILRLKYEGGATERRHCALDRGGAQHRRAHS